MAERPINGGDSRGQQELNEEQVSSHKSRDDTQPSERTGNSSEVGKAGVSQKESEHQ